MSYCMTYPLLNLKIQKNDFKSYSYGLIAIRLIELKQGFKAKKIYKPNNKGTKVKFELVLGADNLKNEFETLKAEFNELEKDLNNN